MLRAAGLIPETGQIPGGALFDRNCWHTATRPLAGMGNVEIQVTAGGIASNPVQITAQ